MNNEIKSYTHVALVLDASGSMSGIRKSTISTLQEFFASLKSPEDRTVIDLWQFDDRVRHLIDGVDIEKGAAEAVENYTTGGCTALYDAICMGIDELGRKFAAMDEMARPDAVVFAVLTDGFENASTEFTVADVKRRIEHQTAKYSWTFCFLAANQDAVLTGREMGLGVSACMDFEATGSGVRKASRKMSDLCCCEVRDISRLRHAAKRRLAKGA